MKKITTFFLSPSSKGICTSNGSLYCEQPFQKPVTKKLTGKLSYFISILAFCIVLFGVNKISYAQITSGFELDGNAVSVTPNPPDDWDLIYNGTSHAQVTTGIVTDLPNGNDNAFQQGSSDLGDIPSWHWTLFSTPDKDDILHAGAALYNNDQIYFFGDRYATNGDAQIGFWFFKSPVSPMPDGSFSGHHTVGDILLLSDFVNGGGVSVISAYEWVGSGGSDGSLNSLNVNGTNLFAIVNNSNQSSPWSFIPKTGPVNIFGPGAFYEGGIDLTGLDASIDPCFTSFLLETRSSQSLTAELKDFVFGNFFTQPQVTVNSATICPGGGPVTLTATIVGGTAPFNYSWSNGATTASITVSPSSTTTYTVVVTAANGCVSNPVSGTVTVNPTPPCSIGNISPGNLICNHGNYTISTSLNPSLYTFSWSMTVDGSPPGWAIVGSNTGQTITFSAGNCGAPGFQVHFTLTVTDAIGCTSSCTANFSPGAPACVVDIRPPVVLTCAVTSQYLLANYSTDIINSTFSWTRNGSPIGAGINNGSGLDSILISSSGTYRFTITDPANSANTCFAEVIVTQNNTAPGAQASGGQLTCVILSVQLTASSSTGGVSYSWTGPNGFTSGQQNPTVSNPGTYTVVVTDPTNGCTSSATATVTQNITAPGASATGGQLTCVILSVQLTASSSTGGVSYSWTGPNGFTSSQQNPTVSNPGTYTVVVTDPTNGCTSSATATVTQNITAPGASATGGQLTCVILSVQLTASSSTGGVSYSWTGPNGFTSNSQNPTVSNPGTYTVVVTDPTNGCTSSATATVTQNITAPGASATGGQLTCVILSVQLTASSSTGGVSYSWTGPNGFTSSQQNPTVSNPGTYTVVVTDPTNGCTSSATATVTQNITAPGASATGGQLTCVILSVQLTASSSTGGVSYSWTGPNGFTSNSQNPTVSNPGTYTVVVTDPTNGCTSSATATVTQNITAPGASATGGQLTCVILSVQLTASSSTGGVSYSWTGPNGFTSGQQNPTVSNPGTYTVVVTDPTNGCTSSATATVTQNITAPGASATGGQLTCVILSVQLTASSSTGGVSYSWTGPNGFTSSQQNPTVSNPGTYTVAVTDPTNGCTSSATATVTQNITAPGASATGGQLTCVILSVQLTASSSTGGVSYSWTGPNGFTSNQQNPTVSNPGTYTVVVTDPTNGCTSSATATVTQNITAPGASATGGQLTCVILSVQLTASSSTGGVSYSWTGPNGFTSGQQNPTVSNPGTYTVVVTDPTNGCTSSATATVTQNITAPGASATGGQLTCVILSVQLTASSSTGGVSYSWTGPNGFTSGQQNPTVSNPGTYTVVVTDPTNGCTSSATATVTQNITAPGASATGGQLTCVILSVQLTASSSTGGVSYSWTGPNGFTSSQQNPTVSNPGTYTVVVTDPINGCTSSATATVTQNITAPGASATGGQLTCVILSVQLTASSSTGGVSYSWTGPNGFTSNQQNPTVSNPGTYTVVVTDPTNGCTSSATATVTQNITAPGASATGGQLTCVILSVQLTASSSTGGVSYSWTGPNGFTSSQQNPTVSNPGTYTVVVTDPTNGCTSSATATVTQNITPPPCSIGNISPSNLLCNHGNYSIGTSLNPALYSFSWSMTVDGNPPGWTIVGSNTGQTIIFSAGNCGNAGFLVHITLTVTDNSNGCTSSCTVDIAPGAPACVVDIRPPVVLTCAVTSQYLLASYSTDIVNPTFEWMLGSTSLGAGINDGVSLDSILITGPGTYSFHIHDPVNSANDCFASVTVTQDIVPPSCLINNPVSLPNCSSTGNALSVTASSGTGPYTFLWTVTSSGNDWIITGSNNGSSITYTAGSSDTATFTVVVTGANGCSSTCTITLTCQNPYWGCTLGFWKNHPALWNSPSLPIPTCVANAITSLGAPYSGDGTTGASFASVFGVTAAQMSAAGYNPNLTLMQALNLGGGGFSKLARQGVASLLNTCGISANFIYNTVQALTMMHDAIVTLTPEPTASQFANANETQPDRCPPGGPANPHSSRPSDDDVDIGAYPNPFNSSTTVEFTLNTFSAYAEVEIYSAAGQKVATLFNGNAEAGVTYKMMFDGSNYANGIYFCRITAADYSDNFKVVLMR